MKITTILMFVFVFSFAVVAAAGLYNDVANNYDITHQSNASATYNKIQEQYADLEEVNNAVKGTDAAGSDSDTSNFIANINSMWTSIQLFFNNIAFVTELTADVGDDLGIPEVAQQTIIAIILLSIIALIISVAVRWKVD